MELKETALAVTAIAAIALGIAVYQRTPDRVWNRLFAVQAMAGGLWTFVNLLLETADTGAEAEFWLRLSHPAAAVVICSVVDFAWVFPDRMEYANTWRRVILYGIGTFFGLSALMPDFVQAVQVTPHMVDIEYGWAFGGFGLFTVLTVGYADVILLTKAMKLEGVQRVQVIWVLLGLAGTHFIASLVIIIIPLIWQTTAYSGWGAAGYIITLMGMGYAIAKHRLMKPEMALRRVASATVSAGLVLSVGVGAVEALQSTLITSQVPMELAYVIAGLTMGVLIVIVHDRVAVGMRRVLSPTSDPAAVQGEASSHILRTLDSEHLVEYLVQALDDALEPTNVVVYTKERDGSRFLSRAAVHTSGDEGEPVQPAPLEPTDHLVRAVAREGSPLTRDHVHRFQSLGEARRLARAMDEMDAQIVAPMVWEEQLIGLVKVGPKRSGEMYNEEDLRFVAEMGLQASLALRNAELYAQTARLRDFNERILRQMDNAVVVTDPDEEIVIFNEASERLFDIPAEEAVGSTVNLLPEPVANCIRASLQSGRILSSRHFEVEQDERTVPLACSTSPVAGDGDVSQGAVAVISDLTLIQELDRERQEAERLSLIRVISAGMAHEIRNPLVAIRTFAELAPKRLDDPEFRSNFLTVAREEINRIDRLVGDLLTLSKPADAVVEPVQINETCRRVVRSMRGMTETRRLTIELETEEMQDHPLGDGARLHQALLNLVHNAVDAEPAGGRIRITTEQDTSERLGPVVRVRVHNSGSYIDANERDEIFRPFVSNKAKGTGLGLAICQTIIEEHDGEITVTSSREDGTEFTIELPLAGERSPTAIGEATP